MSFLSILLFASAFYLAYARPEPQSWYEAFGDFQSYINDGNVQDAPAVPAQYSVPIPDLKGYQNQLYGFMQDVGKSVDHYMTPIMAKLDLTKQDELKSMGMKGFESYVNSLLLLVQEKENEKYKVDDQTHGDSLPRDEEAYAA